MLCCNGSLFRAESKKVVNEMMGQVVKNTNFEHKICGVPASLAVAMREAVKTKDFATFHRMADGLTNAILRAAPNATVVVSLGGPFRDAFAPG